MSHHEDPLPRLIARLEAGGFDPRPCGPDAYESRCPGHEGSRHNLAIGRGDNGGVLVHCHHEPSCSTEDILAPLGLELRDLFAGDPEDRTHRVNGHGNGKPPAAPKPPKKPRKVHPTREAVREAILWGLHRDDPAWAYVDEWNYEDATGEAVAMVLRFDRSDGQGGREKTYRPVHPVSGGWAVGDPGKPWPLYDLPAANVPGRVVHFVEGEKCADALAGLGVAATTTMHGAKSPKHTDFSPLAGRDVVILPDNDPEGEAYAAKVAEILEGLTPPARVKVVRLPGLEPKGDVADWLAAGGTLEELGRIADVTPWREPEPERQQPPADVPPDDRGRDDRRGRRPRFANYRLVERGNRSAPEPLSQEQLDTRLRELAPGWPKRVGAEDTLFVVRDLVPTYLDSPSRLFAWLDGVAEVDWTSGGRFISQERYYEHLRMNVEAYDAIETLPHFPRLAGLSYCHRPVPAAGDNTLETLLDRFQPWSAEDRELIRAMVLTMLWGGPPGSRPAFLITGPEIDRAGGRGVGKSRLVDACGWLLGGAIDVTPTEQIADVKKRLLSDAARQRRLVRLDNVKSLKFSWADLEGLITSPEVSGWKLWKGEGRRPNTMVWAITLNGAALSRDIAQRVIPIRLRRPVYSPTWESDLKEFVDARRWEIFADCREILEGPGVALTPRTRWAPWEKQVLSRCIGVTACQETIVARQEEFDADGEEAAVVRDYFLERIEAAGRNPFAEKIFLSNRVAGQWLNEASRTSHDTHRATAVLKNLGIDELHKNDHTRGPRGERGFHWIGDHADPDADVRQLDPSVSGSRQNDMAWR